MAEKDVTGGNEKLAKMIEGAKARAGDGYAHGYNGAKNKGSPVSCSEFIDSIRKDAGLGLWLNPGGTQTAWQKIAGGGARPSVGTQVQTAETYQEGKDYPAGTIFVATSGVVGDGTHISMSIGNGQVAESVNLGGDKPGPRIKTGVMDGFYGANPSNVKVGVMEDVGTSDSLGTQVGNVVQAAGGLFDQIAQGIAKGLIRFIRAIYCMAILWPLDWLGGFWWEMALRLTGGIAKYTEGVDFLALIKGESSKGTTGKVEDERLDSESETDAMWNRFFWLFFVVTSYVLAFGTDKQGNTHFDKMWDAGQNSPVGPHGAKGYDETATLDAQASREMTVSSRTGDDLAADARRDISDPDGNNDGDFSRENYGQRKQTERGSDDGNGSVSGRYRGRTREANARGTGGG